MSASHQRVVSSVSFSGDGEWDVWLSVREWWVGCLALSERSGADWFLMLCSITILLLLGRGRIYCKFAYGFVLSYQQNNLPFVLGFQMYSSGYFKQHKSSTCSLSFVDLNYCCGMQHLIVC